jgi:hypothetical protein
LDGNSRDLILCTMELNKSDRVEQQGHLQSPYVLVQTVTSYSRGSSPLAVVVCLTDAWILDNHKLSLLCFEYINIVIDKDVCGSSSNSE